MFRLPGEESYPTPAVIQCPSGADTVEREITVHLRVIPSSEYLQLSRQGDAAVLARIVTGWEGVHDAEGQPLPFTPENLRLAAEIPYFAVGVVRAYMDRFSSVKNFRAPLAL